MTGRRIPAAVEWGAVGALGVAFAILVLDHYTAAQIFDGEDAMVFGTVRTWLLGGPAPWRTGPIGPLPFHHGPMYYWVLAPLLWLSPDPAGVRVVYVALQVGAAALIFALVRPRAGGMGATLAAFALLFSRFYFEVSRQLWHASLLPIFVCGALYFCVRLVEHGRLRDGLWAAGLWAVAVQLHITAVTYGLLVAGAALWQRGRLGTRGLVSIAAFGWACALPIQIGMVQTLLGGLEMPPDWGSSGGGAQGSGISPWQVPAFLAAHLAPAYEGFSADVLAVLVPMAAVAGLVAAAIERRPAPVLLAAAVALGLLVELRLLAHDDAPRYLHPNAYACFALAGFGWRSVMDRMPRGVGRFAAIALGVLAAAAAAEALTSPVPTTDWPALTASQQRALARVVAPALPGPSPRIHGAYLNDQQRLVGEGYFHQVFATGAGTAPEGAHLLVADASAGLTPYAIEVLETRRVGTRDGDFVLTTYRPALDFEALRVRGPLGDVLLDRWSIEGAVLREPAPHEVTVPALRPGLVHVLVRWMHSEEGCRVTADVDGVAVDVGPGPSVASGQMDTLRIRIARPGLLTVRVAPCRVPPRLDLL